MIWYGIWYCCDKLVQVEFDDLGYKWFSCFLHPQQSHRERVIRFTKTKTNMIVDKGKYGCLGLLKLGFPSPFLKYPMIYFGSIHHPPNQNKTTRHKAPKKWARNFANYAGSTSMRELQAFPQAPMGKSWIERDGLSVMSHAQSIPANCHIF